MPLLKEWSPDRHSLAAIWQISEDEIFFTRSFSAENSAALQTRLPRHPKRKLEFLAGRFLLQRLRHDFPLHHIQKDAHDKPRIPLDRYRFSISHSGGYAAAIVSNVRECGIDIQCWHPRIQLLAPKFLSENEQSLLDNDAKLFTLGWCIKEAIYKWNGRRGLDFIRDMQIVDFNASESCNAGVILKDGTAPKRLLIGAELAENYAVSWLPA